MLRRIAVEMAADIYAPPSYQESQTERPGVCVPLDAMADRLECVSLTGTRNVRDGNLLRCRLRGMP
jgi:hypothetical protein